MGYGTGNSVRIEASRVVAEIASRIGRTPIAVVLRWTYQSGVGTIPRSKDPEHIEENLKIFDFELNADDMEALNRLNDEHPYYWVSAAFRPQNVAFSLRDR